MDDQWLLQGCCDWTWPAQAYFESISNGAMLGVCQGIGAPRQNNADYGNADLANQEVRKEVQTKPHSGTLPGYSEAAAKISAVTMV